VSDAAASAGDDDDSARQVERIGHADKVAVTSDGPSDQVLVLRRSFDLSLRAEGKRPRTVQSYLEALDQLTAFLDSAGMPTQAARITREHVEAFLVSLRDQGRSPATIANRYRSLQQFWRWCIEEGEITESSMRNMRQPAVPVQPVAVLSDDDVRALLATCKSRSFEDLRDAALLRLMVDTNPTVRRAHC
jgi:site-specific recombinase XerD